jgi:ABC-2 type transporter
VVPQILLCGLFVARDSMAGWLHAISNVLPMTYAVEALQEVGDAAPPQPVDHRHRKVTARGGGTGRPPLQPAVGTTRGRK